jgi:hypothetical protein
MTQASYVPFNELPAEEQNDLLAWVRTEKERKRQEDPVVFVRLQFPDGSDANNEVHEMHRSLAVQMNDDRRALYMRSQRARAEKLAAWEKAVRDAEKQAAKEFRALKQQAEEASVSEIPLSDSKQSAELLSYRRSNVVEVQPPEPKVIPRPDASWNDDDALWVRVRHGGAGVIRHSGTEVYKHD